MRCNKKANLSKVEDLADLEPNRKCRQKKQQEEWDHW